MCQVCSPMVTSAAYLSAAWGIASPDSEVVEEEVKAVQRAYQTSFETYSEDWDTPMLDHVTIPCVRPNDTQSQRIYGTDGILHVEAQEGRPCVLVVDDEPSIAGLLAEFLDSAGYQVVIANNGRNALTVARAVHPELVLTDLMMPELDGVDLIKTLQAQSTTRDIPVVMMSSIRPADAQLGRVPFLEKPFDLDHVLDVVALYAAEPQPELS